MKRSSDRRCHNLYARWVLISIFLLTLFLAGCAAAAPESGKQPEQNISGLQEIAMEEAQEIWRNKAAIFIDVRTPAEYKQGHVPGAVLIPLNELANRQSEVPKDKKVLLICRSGSRSAQANAMLQRQGFTNTYSVKGGMLDWHEAVESDQK